MLALGGNRKETRRQSVHRSRVSRIKVSHPIGGPLNAGMQARPRPRRGRLPRASGLLRLAPGAIFIRLLHDERCLLLLSVFGEEAFAIVAVLQDRDVAGSGAKVQQHPWCSSAKLRDLCQHHELMLIDIGLLFLGPALGYGAVVADFGFGPKLAHDERLLREGPMDAVGVFRSASVPADVLIETHDIERVSERVVQNSLIPGSAIGIESRRDEARWIELPGFIG